MQAGVGALGGAQVHAADDGFHREGRLLPQSGGNGQFGRVALAVNQQVGFLPGTTPRPKPNSRSEECKHAASVLTIDTSCAGGLGSPVSRKLRIKYGVVIWRCRCIDSEDLPENLLCPENTNL